MLILERKAGERVLVGDKVIVTIVRIGPNKVRIGVTAPPDMLILREELDRTNTKECDETQPVC